MSSVVMDLEAALQAMQNTKPPGVSGSKIALITELSVHNVQSESVIIQKLYTHFKKCPGTHKLGPLYVVDSIARRYLDQAKKNHQEVSAAAPDGTFAAGVFRITNLLPPLLNDILQHSPPEENKDKIEKLYAIWERSSTFPPEVLADVKKKMYSSPMFQSQNPPQSSTPPGSPPRHLQTQFAQPQPQSQLQVPLQLPNTDVASMLQAIAQMAKQSQSTVANPMPPTAEHNTSLPPQYNVPNSQPNGHQATAPNTSMAIPQPPMSLPAPIPVSLPYTSTPPNTNGHPTYQSQMTGAYPMYQQSQPQQQTGFPQFNAPQQHQLQQPQVGMEQLALLQLLLQQPGLQNASQLAPALQALLGGGTQGFQIPNASDPMQQQQQFWSQASSMPQPQAPVEAARGPDGFIHEQRRERGYSPPPRSPPRYGGARRGRSRSRSPARFGREEPRSPPNFRRRSPVYGEYEGNNESGRSGSAGSTGGGSDRGRGGRNRGRRATSPRRKDRSPQGGRAAAVQASPPPRDLSLPKVPKNVTFASDIGPTNVRVLSRTLFVGGVTIGDDDLRQLFENFGQVQSCIVNQDKRHAFIKMLTREDAVKAKSGMETYRTENMTLRTRWGVGFGPRDCSDYQTGVSVIPIDRLTEADQRWMVSAEYGGTGGQPLQGGMCVEEPDIEIGQGVSSKAISKRFPTDSGGNKGPRSSHEPHAHGGPTHRGGGGGGGKRKDHPKGPDRAAAAAAAAVAQGPPGGRDNVGVAPPTPGFGAGFPFALPNRMAGFPYTGFPGSSSAPPPPGR